MTDLDRLLAEAAIARLITRYAALNDAGRWADLAALYTPDGRMNRPTAPDAFVEGRQAILDSFLARPARAARHIVANILVEITSPDSATATSQILLFTAQAAPDGGLPIQSRTPPLVGSYADRLVRQDGEWRFVERRGSFDFRAG